MARKIKEKCGIHSIDFPFYQYVETMVWCEECSTQEHPIMMTKMDGSYFRCPLCEKEVMVMQDIKTNVGTHWSSVCSRCKELEEKNIRFGRKNGKI